jgi:hypothetical protein
MLPGVAHAKGHHQEFEQSLMRVKGDLLHIIRMHQHLVVPGAHVKLGEEYRPVELIQQFFDDWNRELIFDCLVVEPAVVDSHTPRFVLLLDEEH